MAEQATRQTARGVASSRVTYDTAEPGLEVRSRSPLKGGEHAEQTPHGDRKPLVRVCSPGGNKGGNKGGFVPAEMSVDPQGYPQAGEGRGRVISVRQMGVSAWEMECAGRVRRQVA